ncbi:MAG: xanthine dehydrogenase accessory factor [Paraglaciecola psychrophila]|jgi:xanthine dehydrogenase accessory factor
MQWFNAVNQLASAGEAYVIVTVMGARGSTPRDSGSKMVVTLDGSYCSIGGGHLEFQAMAKARELLLSNTDLQQIEHFPLGAKLGQCCGGSATVLFESFASAQLNIMLFGAGHVGKALAGILAQLHCRLHWVDSRAEQFPDTVSVNTSKTVIEDPLEAVATMPANSYFIVMSHQHPLDFALTEAILKRGDAAYIGLIGSDTKWQRFKLRFEHRQYSPDFYQAVRCPVGLSEVSGKLPIEVAVSIAGEIIAHYQQQQAATPMQQGVSWKTLKKQFAEPAQRD